VCPCLWSDERTQGARACVALTSAEYFCDEGQDMLLFTDNVSILL
jgi:F0F1-type ATP synthase beta subunit